MYSGYIFTSKGEDALSLIGTQGVRYAAVMSDWSGFAAFDSEDDIGEGSMAVKGWVVTAMEPHPDYPPSWPDDWGRGPGPRGPKRQIARGDEHFALYAAGDRKSIPVPRAGCWVTDGVRIMLLVEHDGNWHCNIEPIWEAEVVQYDDVRMARTP